MVQEQQSFIRSAGLISAFTLLSRLLGIVRDAACAAIFGAGAVWDAFSFAFRIPNLLRRLFGEGALSAAFMPIFAEYLETRTRDEAERLAARIAGALVLLLVGLLLVGEGCLLWLREGVSLGPRWQLTLALTAVLLPYAVLICLTAFAGAILNAMKHFAAPALAPVVLNVTWIAAVVAVAPRVASDATGRVFVVAVGILIAGLLQLALQVAVLRAKGFRWRLALEPAHAEVRRVAASMLPVALGLAAFQINVLLDGVLAISLAGPQDGATFGALGMHLRYPMEVGANSVLYYANRLMQFPLGVFGIALATAIFPTLSRQAARADWAAFARSVVRGLGLVIFIGIPAGVGLIVLRRPIIELIFQRGEFTARTTARTAACLLAYSVAIWAYCGQHVLTRAFYSIGQPATPARLAAAAVVLNLVLNLLLVWPLREAGLAAGTAVSATVQALILCRLLHRRVPLTGLAALLRTIWKTAVATILMAGAAGWTLHALPDAADAGIGLKLLRVLLPAAAGALVFGGTAALLRTAELRFLLRPETHHDDDSQRADS